MLLKKLFVVIFLLCLPLSVFSQEEMQCNTHACFKTPNATDWPHSSDGGTGAQFGAYRFAVPDDFSEAFSSDDLLVFKGREGEKLVFSKRQRSELEPSLPKDRGLFQWSKLVFEGTPKQANSADEKRAMLFKKGLLGEVEQLLKFEKGDIVAYLYSGEKQQPFSTVVMLFNKKENQTFVMLEYNRNNFLFVEKIIGSLVKK